MLWGGQTVVLRISIVEPDVPFLLSKFVFKCLGARIDLDSNTIEFNKLNGALETLHDLSSGHVAIELVKPNVGAPKVSDNTLKLCADGEEEVTVENEQWRKRLNACARSHGTHVVDIPGCSHLQETDDGDDETLKCCSETDEQEEDASLFYFDVLNNSSALTLKNKNMRGRAAPLFNELMPGWRARARDIVPSYQRRHVVFNKETDAAKFVPGMEFDGGATQSGSI